MKIGFVGGGKLTEAMVAGLLDAGVAQAEDVAASDIDPERRKLLESRFSIRTHADNSEVVDISEITILALKPNALLPAASDLEPDLSKLIITVAAGMNLSKVQKALPDGTHLVRVMPNISCAVRSSCTAICGGDHASEEDMKKAEEIFGAVGMTFRVDEKHMDVVTALSGSGPAYAFIFIEALSDGAVLHGLPREQAIPMAAQTVLGAARMVLDSGLHPAQLKDRVCSPGGTTIEAVRTLEESGFRSAAIEAVSAAHDKSRSLAD